MEDDGESYDYEKGAVARTTFDCAQNGQRVDFTVQPVKGQYKGMYTSRTYKLEVYTHRRPTAVKVNGVATKDFTYSPEGIVSVTLPQKDVHAKATVSIQ